MAKTKKQMPIWRVSSLRSDYEWEGLLEAYWEVTLDPISDNYTLQEIDARELFHEWEKLVCKEFPGGLIPISWFVQCREAGKFNLMPLQFNHFPLAC